MKVRYPGVVVVCILMLLSVTALAATKKPKAESNKSTDQAEKTSQVSTNDAKPKVDLNVYQLRPSDKVEVRVYQEDDLTTKGSLAKDGTITIHLLGVVTIGGKTVEQAATHIKQLLAKDYLVNPQVTVTVLEYAKKRFRVVGEVNRQGTYEIPDEESMDLVGAIALAGGRTRIARPSKVTVTRIVDGKKVVLGPFNIGDEKAKPVEILPEDTITVPESAF